MVATYFDYRSVISRFEHSNIRTFDYFSGADLPADFACPEDLPDFSVEDAHHMLRALATECGDPVDDLVFLEKNAVHAVLVMFAPSAPSDSSTAT